VEGVVKALIEQVDELVDELTHAVDAAARFAPLTHDKGRQKTCADSVRSILTASSVPMDFDPEPAKRTGARRADQTVPLTATLESDRIAFQRLRELVTDEFAKHPNVEASALQSTTINLLMAENLFTTAMFAGYQQSKQIVRPVWRRDTAVDALLYGQALDDWRLGEIANCLRLPSTGPFVVIAAANDTAASEALPRIESKLRSLDVYSAWRLLPDLHVGIAHIGSDHQLDKVLTLLTRTAANHVGVSARFNSLDDVPHALHCAKVSMRGCRTRTTNVIMFDGSILATAAVSAPSAMLNAAATVLDCFVNLMDYEREILIQTFRVWQDNDASIPGAAELLHCHPNTVRSRLRRIERCTNRLLSRPRDLVEICLAFEVDRQFT
jgi:hypothetical protein